MPLRIRLVAVSTRVPDWVREGVECYRRRLTRDLLLDLIEVPAVRRGPNTGTAKALQVESERVLRAARGARLVALDEHGDQPSTRELAVWMRGWMDNAQEVALLVGGADGLTSECLRATERRWSLSRLTLPHALVRVVVAEQCYRAWSLLAGHPYHRD